MERTIVRTTETQSNVAEITDANVSGDVSACCPAELLPANAEATPLVALTDRLKVLADETRLHMLELLIAHGEPLCVCEITEQFDLSQSTISHHLRLLREALLIHAEKRGTWMYYAATDEGRRCMGLARKLV
jgi:ArsR family transcriptional regulator, arsenate/arsenite/antimonite-responsive transcriptional repressor